MRNYQHVVDTKAIKKTLNSIPDYCVVRDLTERDYGIDLMVEIFEKNGEDKNGHDTFDATGHVCYLQIKGTNTEINKNKNSDTVSFSVEKKLLFYVEKLATPFILVRVCTLHTKEVVYFLWLQRYISDILDTKHPNWRTDETKETYTVRIPIKNSLPDNFEKIKKVAARIKYIEELSEFHERYQYFNNMYHSIIADKFYDYPLILSELNRIKNLNTLLNFNNLCIRQESIVELTQYLESVRDGIIRPSTMEDFPNNFNLEQLHQSNKSLMFIEEFVAENEDDTVF